MLLLDRREATRRRRNSSRRPSQAAASRRAASPVGRRDRRGSAANRLRIDESFAAGKSLGSSISPKTSMEGDIRMPALKCMDADRADQFAVDNRHRTGRNWADRRADRRTCSGDWSARCRAAQIRFVAQPVDRLEIFAACHRSDTRHAPTGCMIDRCSAETCTFALPLAILLANPVLYLKSHLGYASRVEMRHAEIRYADYLSLT